MLGMLQVHACRYCAACSNDLLSLHHRLRRLGQVVRMDEGRSPKLLCSRPCTELRSGLGVGLQCVGRIVYTAICSG
jgi:hypothetical protein